jgi:hypothetical protein
MENQSFFIKPNVFFAEVQNEGVILDLQGDQYYALDERSTYLWKTLADSGDYNQAKTQLKNSLGMIEEQVEDSLRDLFDVAREAKLLAESHAIGYRLPRSLAGEAAKPAQTYLDPDKLQHTKYDSSSVATVSLRLLLVKLQLRYLGLPRTLAKLPPLPKTKLLIGKRDRTLYEIRKTLGVVRSLFTRGEPDCLPRSLTMTHLLRSRGVHSEICFGIQKFPFEAHAWVESEGEVVSTSNGEKIARFVVIARF